MTSKFEQCINIKFLAKLGKNEHEAYQILKKVYGNRCISRSCASAYYKEYNNVSEKQCIAKVEKTEEEIKKMDTDNIEDIASSSDTYRARSNSVIDSGGFRKYCAVLESGRTRIRSKSLSTTDYFISTDQCESMSITTETESNEAKTPDTIDAKANNILFSNISDPVSPFKEPTAYMPVAKDADRYNMDHKNRGKCIIFNHEKFDFGYDKREGSSLDAKRLRRTFGNLGFDVEIYNDFTHKEIMDYIDKVSQLDHTDNDCLCVITLTHGAQNDFICAKDVIYKSDTIWKPFAADKCTTLAGKPKLFFIQACRGEESDSGVVLSPRSMTKTETDSVVSYTIPTHADFLIAHSSIQGFFTWRNPLEGTWYIQCLCDVLDHYGTTMDLMSMLTVTARKVATDFSSVNTDNITLHKKRQIPSVTSMLIRHVYFPPKLKK